MKGSRSIQIDDDVRADWRRSDVMFRVEYKIAIFWQDVKIKPLPAVRLKMSLDEHIQDLLVIHNKGSVSELLEFLEKKERSA